MQDNSSLVLFLQTAFIKVTTQIENIQQSDNELLEDSSALSTRLSKQLFYNGTDILLVT